MDKDMKFEAELKELFKKEAPELPEALKKENVMNMINNDTYVPKKKKHIFAKIVAVAAAFMIVVASALALPLIIPERGLVEAETTTQAVTQVQYKVIDNGFKATKLLKAQSNDDLVNHFLRIYRENRLDNIVDGAFGLFSAQKGADMAAPEMESAVMTTAAANAMQVPEMSPEAPGSMMDTMTTGATDDSFGQTNTQVENVDEADIIKNDGKYLYILSGGTHKAERRVTILDAGKMSVASRIEIADEDYLYNIQEMFVNGDRLVILATEYEKVEYEEGEYYYYDTYYGYRPGKGQVVSFLYDISDRSSPKLVRKVSQDGSDYISSRMIDGVLYTVSQYVVRADSEKEVRENALPSVNGKEITCDCIYIYDYDSDRYNILTAYDTKLDEGEVSSVSILGSGDEIYCSQDALYVAARAYDREKGEDYSEIYSFSLDKTEISFKASGTVKGTFLNQFSFDEYEGNLRIATTYYSYKHDVDVSSVYVLNKDLQLIGALEDIAYDEQVKSARFMGATGYLVTFRNTDPLFTLDLSEPTNPKIIGEVKLPGFSSYLHPVAEGYVVGLGYDGDEESADFSSLKVSLFDVRDLKAPKEVDTFVLKDVHSQALDNPKAFITYPEAKLIGFPVEHYGTGDTVRSYKLLKIENGEISSHLGYVHQSERVHCDVFRGTYIGKKLYTIDNYNVCEFDILTAELLRQCEILDVEEDLPDYKEYLGDEGYTTAVAVTVTSQAYNPATEPITTTSAVSVAVATTAQTQFGFVAEIAEINGTNLLVEVTESRDSSFSVGTHVVVSLKESEIANYEEGMAVEIVYDGMAEETYPLRIVNLLSIEKA